MIKTIQKFPNGNIAYKYHRNNNQWHGLQISYYLNGNIEYKGNYINGKLYGLYTWWCDYVELYEQTYHL